MTQQNYTGLNDTQVLESRARYGANILTPPKKNSLWDQLKIVLRHWIAIWMYILVTGSLIGAFFLQESVGNAIWVMPAITALSALLILVVGFFGAFQDPLFKILITAFVLSMGISVYEFECSLADWTTFFEPIGIIAALLLATGVSFFLERNNEKTFQSLNEVNDDTLVKVIRNGNPTQVARKDVVVGDIVILEAGEEIPADAQLLESLNLSVDESSLTGEPLCRKSTREEDFDKEATYASNEILKGTIVREGSCVAEVTKVGDATESGKVFEAAQVDAGQGTPLSAKLDRLAGLITKLSYTLAGLIVVGRICTWFILGQNPGLNSTEAWLSFVSYLLDTVMIAVTLIVVAVPEGLPMSVTLSLAFSMRKLMKEKTLPRTMHSCETMGATSVICTDKTGTLTQNKMQVVGTDLCEANEALVYEMLAVNTTANLDFSNPSNIQAIGNPTEGALLLWLHGKGVGYADIRSKHEILERIQFSSENKYMATIVNSAVMGRRMLYVKGAPEIVMGLCDIPENVKASYEAKLLEYQGKARRTLGLAYLALEDNAEVIENGRLKCRGLKFAGIFGIEDPVRKEVPDAIRSCIDAGIQVKIVTGDTPGTAKEIGRQIGLWTEKDGLDNILTGVEFAAMSDAELSMRIPSIKIMARSRPNDKERLVRLLKAKDYVVAVTGDGTNDAPALNAADVGLSMGDGTAVAKEASDMTIMDSSFSTISNAVMWGRSLYKNIQRFIMFQMTINVVATLIVLLGAFVGTSSPLTVTQMLWVNLIMDTFAAIALASLPPSRLVMKDRPRKITDNIISKSMALRIFSVGGLFTILLLAVLLLMQHSDITSMPDLLKFRWGPYNGLSAYELSLFFTLFVMLQFWNMFNAKAFMTGKSAFANLKACRGFILTAVIIFFGQILIVELGGKMFSVCHLRLTDWFWIIASTSLVLWVGEIFRKKS
ncbi:MAG: calcium-translocating P-type ATPase, PMCA-type [Bacteroidales bacterium]|nr:calcium-translocating P-type ATPase, PMCA-type [Bacteroidales bacterium]